jgi:hypothetical protein
MRNKILLIGVVVLLALVASAWAADVTGKWKAEVQGRQGATEYIFDFKVNGTTLSGTLTTPQGENAISEGKVSGDEISFVTALSFGGREIKIAYKGKVAGDEIKLTREMQGGPGGGREGAPGGGAGGGRGGAGMGEIIAKRVK